MSIVYLYIYILLFYNKMGDNVLQKYTREQVYLCVKETANKLGVSEDDVLKILEKIKYKGITNYVLYPSRNLRVLSGPDVIVFFRNILGKRILLLGETHHVKHICDENILKEEGAFEVQEYLIHIGLDAKKCLDIFTETDYRDSRLKERCISSSGKISNFKSALTAVDCRFYKLKLEKSIPGYVRYHNIDTRVFDNDFFPMVRWNARVFNDKNAIGWDAVSGQFNEIQNRFEVHKYQLIGYILTLNKTKKAHKIYNEYMTAMFKLIGEIYNKEYYDVIFNKYVDLVNKEFTKIHEVKKSKVLSVLSSVYFQHFALYSSLLNCPMDLYFLTRLFIKFDEKKINRGPEGCRKQINVTVNDVIVYAGSNHTKAYYLFLKTYFNKEFDLSLGQGGVWGSQCIRFPQPFDFFTY